MQSYRDTEQDVTEEVARHLYNTTRYLRCR